MPPTYLVAPDVVCMNRAKNDANYHYLPYINSLQKLLEKKNSTKVRLELNRVKQWVKEYEVWAKNWHKNNYVRLSDCYSNPEEAHPSECVPPPVAPFFEVYSDLNLQS
jgi:hypothetical protein